jgi:hypothetical protein
LVAIDPCGHLFGGVRPPLAGFAACEWFSQLQKAASADLNRGLLGLN